MGRLHNGSVFLLGWLFCVCLYSAPALSRDDMAAFIRTYLAVGASTPNVGPRRLAMTSLKTFYAKRGFQPVWVPEGSGDGRIREALTVLNGATSHGIDKGDYAAHQISQRLAPRTAIQRAQLEISLSKALTRYALDLRGYRVGRKSIAGINKRTVSHDTVDGLLQRATTSKNLRAFFDGLAPRSPRYRRLRQALLDYRRIAKRGGWPIVAKGPLLRQGMRGDRISILRHRLVVTGDLNAQNIRGDRFDAEIEAAVRIFQKRHGLTEDGIVGTMTRAALNVPVQRRLQQLRVNLKRRRSIPDDLGSHYVFVNMADFVLKVVKDRRTVLAMKVVVGTPYRQTPLFTANMTYIDFNPYWNIPRRITVEEIAPRARRDASYLTRQGIRVFSGWDAQARELAPQGVNWHAVGRDEFPYRLRQEPGPLNPLGRVKFMFPNSFEVYLHDTPARQLFSRAVRAFSHGCIRVEKPVSLAAHLLSGLTTQETRQIMESGKRRIFHLAKPIPVHLTYLTAWVNKDGLVHFRKDVYGRDRLLTNASR